MTALAVSAVSSALGACSSTDEGNGGNSAAGHAGGMSSGGSDGAAKGGASGKGGKGGASSGGSGSGGSAANGAESGANPSETGGTSSGGASSTGASSGTSSGGTSSSGASGGTSNGGTPSTGGSSTTGGTSGSGGSGSDLGAYPVAPSTVTRGGTMTFTEVGAPGWWPRRIDREAGDPACDYKDGTDTWGGHCCMKEQETTSSALAPFNAEMTLILKAIDVKQLAVYQPSADAGDAASAPWSRVTDYDARSGDTRNLWFTQEGDGSSEFPGDLTHDDCVGYLSQAPTFACGDGRDYYCPNDPGVLHQGFSGSKLIVFLGSMVFDDAGVRACNGDDAGHPGPWVALVASELIRDGGRKWNGLCNCYSKTGSVGDGCGEINVFEVVMDDNEYSNREFASTGVRSFQAGHVGGAVCKSDCERDAFAGDADVVDACAKAAYDTGPELEVGGDTTGCPVWRRPEGDRYFFILLDEATREIQVGMIHPDSVPSAAETLLPELPGSVTRAAIDDLLALRLPG